MLKVKPYNVLVDGFDPVLVFAASPGKARADGWRQYRSYRDISFRDFLKIGRVRRGVAPAHFGDQVVVAGLPAFFVGFGLGNCHSFVRPDSDRILLAHEAEFEGLPSRTVVELPF